MKNSAEALKNGLTTLQIRKIAVDATSEYVGVGRSEARQLLRAARRNVQVIEDPLQRFGESFEQAAASRMKSAFLDVGSKRWESSVPRFYAYLPHAGFSREEQLQIAEDFRTSVRRVNGDATDLYAAKDRVASAINRRTRALGLSGVIF